MEHKFGNENWTSLKLQALKKYLHFYNTALKQQHFTRHYIDGFAGIGRVTINTLGGERVIDGSAKIALETTPPFDAIHLIDASPSHTAALEELCAGHKHCEIRTGDANTEIMRLLGAIPWRQGHRAVLFLDPYGMEVEWQTLKAISATHAIDLWYLFPLAGLYRNAPKKLEALDAAKRAALTRCLGTSEWEHHFYAESPQQELFDDPAVTRMAEWRELLNYVQNRLDEVFAKVAKPLILPASGAPLFALFFAVSNPSPKAIALSMKAANHILNSQRPVQPDTPHKPGH